MIFLHGTVRFMWRVLHLNSMLLFCESWSLLSVLCFSHGSFLVKDDEHATIPWPLAFITKTGIANSKLAQTANRTFLLISQKHV